MTETLLKVSHLFKKFSDHDSYYALKGINFDLLKGECLGIIGENGSGKSTLSRIITLLETPTQGDVCFQGFSILDYNKKAKRAYYKDVQMIFQNPYASFNPLKTFGYSLKNVYHNQGYPSQKAESAALQLLERVRLDASFMKRYPHQVSGGQCQRVAIARALAASPKLLICDEITSDLDMITKTSIVELVGELQKAYDLTVLFISHDIGLVKYLCDRILVLKNGEILEEGSVQKVFKNPQHPYTQQLIDYGL